MSVDLRTRGGSGAAPMARASRSLAAVALASLVVLGLAGPARAGKLSWLDDVVQEVIADAKAGGKSLAREAAGDGARAESRRAGRLFVSREADEGLERLVRQSDEIAGAGRKLDQPAEALLQSRFARLMRHDPQAVRTFAALPAAEKRLVVELGETAQNLARRYPAEAETMVKRLGPEGLTAVRVYGDDVAEVLAREGTESLSVLRRTGRAGWSFFTKQVLPHKKKLIAAGVLAAFLANPEKFVDYAGRATEFAVNEFGKAGIELATAVGGGAARGLDDAIGRTLAAYGLNTPLLRYLAMGTAGLAVVLSVLVIVGLPVRWLFRPIAWPVRVALSVRGTRRAA